MDRFSIINEFLKHFWWAAPAALLIVVFRSAWFKGVLGESMVKLAARFRLPVDIYHPVHNVTLPTPDGTTQIDHVFVSRFGIFVVETKNMKGWIFGGKNEAKWTQKIFRKSFPFQNPLRQNYKHAKALEAVLEVPANTIHSVVVFTGASTFKTPMPANVTHGGGYITYIKSFREPVLSDEAVRAALEAIRSGRLEPSHETTRQHVQRLISRQEPTAERKCPKCGSSMVVQTARRGTNAGNQFWGCSAYPRCKVMQYIT